ncbi:hypothetical protein ACT453_35875, partial [Bacillus sp. D-CC]
VTVTVSLGLTVTVTFQIQINAIPPSGKIENTASVTYTSQPNPNEPPITTTETTPTVTNLSWFSRNRRESDRYLSA